MLMMMASKTLLQLLLLLLLLLSSMLPGYQMCLNAYFFLTLLISFILFKSLSLVVPTSVAMALQSLCLIILIWYTWAWFSDYFIALIFAECSVWYMVCCCCYTEMRLGNSFWFFFSFVP